MRMKIFALAALATGALVLSGCSLLEQWGILKPDLAIKSMIMNVVGTNVTSVSITFSNLGSVDQTAAYSVVLTKTTTVDLSTDYVVYDGTVSIPAGADYTKTLQATDITTYAVAHNPTPPASGNYYGGAIVDASNTLKESDLNNNSATTTTALVTIP
jgi:hypothetical protein